MAKCASCAALEEKGYVVTGDWTAEIRCGECNKVLFEGPSWPDPHLRWIRIGFAQKAAAPNALGEAIDLLMSRCPSHHAPKLEAEKVQQYGRNPGPGAKVTL